MDAMDYEFVEGRDEVNDEANTLRRDVQILRECLERIVSYYDLAKTGSSLPSLTMQAKAEHENTMFGAARRALAKTANPSLNLTAAARAAQPKEHEMTDAESRPAAVGQVERRVRPLPKTQADLLEALRKGVTLCYMPYMGGFNPTAYYFRDDNHQRVTAAAAALLSKGLVEKYEVTRRGHRVRAKAPPAA